MNRQRRTAAIFLAAACYLLAGNGSSKATGADRVVTATLNGLEIVLDGKTGGILSMNYPGPGKMLDTTSDAAGLVDVALPRNGQSKLRLATRFSTDARITKNADEVVVHWDALGASRPSAMAQGKVSATVTLKAAPDGRSVLLECRIDNRSGEVISQPIFPDLMGLVPFGGVDQTQFRLGGSVLRPFADLKTSPPGGLVGNRAIATYTSGSLFSPMVIRWMDLGSLAGGFSLFPRCWGSDAPTTVRLHLSEIDKKLRLMILHDARLADGAAWTSGSFVLTPHVSGWAKGIEPYRQWARQNIRPLVPMPDHVRKGMGFRTIFMCQGQPLDPRDAVFRFRDLPKLAAESREHGLDEMVLWFVHPCFELPLPPSYEHLGGDAGLVRAVAECKKLGVNVAPFVSVCIATDKTKAKYGALKASANYTYHTEFIPPMNPPYASRYNGYSVDTRNAVWRREALASCKRLVDIGLPSLCWDQFHIHPPEPNLLTVARELRTYSRRHDPQSTFSGEDTSNLEISCDYLDYTWNWNLLRDMQPITSVFPAPRVNVNIDASPANVKFCFVQNRYMNVQPRTPDGVNGSSWIADRPELSRALKQCAKLRSRFLPYFVEGALIGDCILSEPCANALIGSYVLPDGALLIVLNQGKKDVKNLGLNLQVWLPSASGRYKLRAYNEEGKLTQTTEIQGNHPVVSSGALEPLEMELFELNPQ
jgi:hypothetical protein